MTITCPFCDGRGEIDADTRKGRRPSFVYAADPAEAAELVEAFACALTIRKPGHAIY